MANIQKVFIKDLKKGNKFEFSGEFFEVKQKLSDWKKDGEPYLLTKCGQIFWFDELEVTLL